MQDLTQRKKSNTNKIKGNHNKTSNSTIRIERNLTPKKKESKLVGLTKMNSVKMDSPLFKCKGKVEDMRSILKPKFPKERSSLINQEVNTQLNQFMENMEERESKSKFPYE